MTQRSSTSKRAGKASYQRALTKVPGGFSPFGNPMPTSLDVSFKYVDRITIDAAGSGAIANYIFSANGMYDPDVTGTGHQPTGFDQWLGTSSTTGFYNHYHVYKSEIKVTASSQAADNTGQAVVLLGLSDDTTVGIDFNTLLENPTYKALHIGSVGSGRDTASMSHVADMPRYFGIPRDSIYAKDDLRGIYSSNPAEGVFFILAVGSNNPTVNPAAVALVVEIVYHAHLSERRELTGS